jgi:hypothetical protein
MSVLLQRRARPTIRCLRDDLLLELPTVEVDLGSIEHPLMDEARRVAPSAPRGQKRILAIDHPLVYRLRHGRWRGATWLEEDASRFWLLAGAERAAGSRDDAYEVFVAEALRELLFGIVFAAAGAEVWEPRPDCPSGPLEWFEVARLGLREPISPA